MYVPIQCIRDVGVVNMVFDDGDVQVRYSNNSVFTFNTFVLVKVHIHVDMYVQCIKVLSQAREPFTMAW